MAQETDSSAHLTSSVSTEAGHGTQRLGAFLCWAVVFADIGTSVYYTPGILYGQVGRLAGVFVTMTLVVFLLLTLKYAEVTVRFPEGGGVVTVAARGINPWAGAVGGMFILVDYFLTSAISSLSGIQYFTDVLPRIGPYVLPITVVVVVALGVLNWWGIKESAIVSAAIAVAALLSDLAILVVVLWNVPLHTIGLVFQEMFSGQHLTPTVFLTGFAGAFLAFSGLESISQLSPVMRAPRKKTVNWALALVAITVGVTSPLLTIFSTTLLNAATVDPNKFISQLAGAYGGDLLKIFTAITASALLVFASNTAIIGAYHVFLALSRMRFFPEIVEKTNKMRGTPHVSIALATFIPLAVLLAVRGQIDLLGDMYAFGLLGAFSLTCVALDVIRYRERHGQPHVGAREEAELHETAHDWLHQPGVTQARVWFDTHVSPRLSPGQLARVRSLAESASQGWSAAGQVSAPARQLFARAWPDLKYYLGFLTTFLVGVAWLTNLVAKPLATEFGGGLTVLGVGIAVIHYRAQQRKGQAPVFLPMRLLHPIPSSILVLLPSGDAHNAEVIRAAVSKAGDKPVVFLALGPLPPEDVSFMQFADPYLADRDASDTLAMARNLAERAHVSAYYVYRVGGARSVSEVWRIIQPDELIATVEVAKKYARDVAPEYVRRQVLQGITIEHRVRRHRPSMGEASATISSNPPAVGPIVGRGERGGRSGSSGAQPTTRPATSAKGQATPEADSEDWVWTGTDLVRRDPDGKDRQGGE